MSEKELRKMEIAQKMKNLRIASGLTQAQVADKLGITYQAVSNYERGKNSIEADVLFAMCDIYNVDAVSILRSGMYLCPVCGFCYNSDFASEVEEHEKFHKSFCKAVEYFGEYCIPSYKWNSVKVSAYETLDSKSASQEDRVNALLNLIKVYFSRSVSAWGYDLGHPKFEEYAAMLLNQERFQKYDTAAYNTLVSKYGKKSGIPGQETTYKIQDIINSLQGTPQKKSIKKSPSDLSEEARKIARSYDKMTPHGKGAVQAILNYEEKELSHFSQHEDHGKVITLPKSRKSRSGMVEINVYDQPAAAGLGNYLDEPEYRVEQYPADVIPDGTDFGVLIDGDSMEPRIHNGGTVFVHAQVAIDPGKIGVFVLDGKVYCKQLTVDHENRQVRLVSLNKAYDDILVGEFASFRTLGHVIGQWTPGRRNDDIFGW